MNTTPEYDDGGAWIPQGWALRSVGEMGEVRAGKALAIRAAGRLRPYLRTKNVFDGRIDLSDLLQMPMTDAEFARYRLRHGDVLLNEGQSIDLVGRCALYRNECPEPCAIQNQLVRFRARAEVSSRFAAHLFRHAQATGVFSRIALQTTSVAHLGVSRFAALILPWPTDLIEQEAIADALGDADALIESLEELLAKKRQTKQGAMQTLFTGERRLPGYAGGWSIKRLGELGGTFGGLTGKTKRDFGHGAARYITFMNVLGNVVIDCDVLEFVDVAGAESQNQVAKGDLFFNGSSETPEDVGLCAVLLQDAPHTFLNSFCFGFRLKQSAPADGLYLAYFFRSRPGRMLLRSLAQGATRYNLSKTALLQLELPLPCPEEQRAIAHVLADIDVEINALDTKLAKARQIKQGMMQTLLTGRVRLMSGKGLLTPAAESSTLVEAS